MGYSYLVSSIGVDTSEAAYNVLLLSLEYFKDAVSYQTPGESSRPQAGARGRTVREKSYEEPGKNLLTSQKEEAFIYDDNDYDEIILLLFTLYNQCTRDPVYWMLNHHRTERKKQLYLIV